MFQPHMWDGSAAPLADNLKIARAVAREGAEA